MEERANRPVLQRTAAHAVEERANRPVLQRTAAHAVEERVNRPVLQCTTADAEAEDKAATTAEVAEVAGSKAIVAVVC